MDSCERATLSPAAYEAVRLLQAAVIKGQEASETMKHAWVDANAAVAGLTFDDIESINRLQTCPAIEEAYAIGMRINEASWQKHV